VDWSFAGLVVGRVGPCLLTWTSSVQSSKVTDPHSTGKKGIRHPLRHAHVQTRPSGPFPATAASPVGWLVPDLVRQLSLPQHTRALLPSLSRRHGEAAFVPARRRDQTPAPTPGPPPASRAPEPATSPPSPARSTHSRTRDRNIRLSNTRE
jgi:hypothetical protein